MYKIGESPFINLKKNFLVLSSPKSLCTQLERDIFNFINLIRQKPSKLLKYLPNNDFELEQLINFIHNLSQKNLSFPPLIQKKELTRISNDLLNYIINIKKTNGEIKFDLIANNDINLRKRSAPDIKIKGKYYEGIVLENNNLIEIISYILKDVKGRNILFNENIKYIGIACGVIENDFNSLYNKNKNSYKICTIIDLVQDFDFNNDNNSYLIDKRYEYNTKEKITKNKYILPKSFSYDKITKRKIKRKKYHNNFIKENTYDNIFIKNKKADNLPLLKEKEKVKEKNNLTYDHYIKVKSKTPNNNDLNKIYKNNSLYSSKYAKISNKKKENKKEKELDDISESNSKSASTLSRQRSKKKLKPEEKIELLKQINKESREKSKKKKSFIKIDDDSKSASFTTKKNNVSYDASFSEIISIDLEKKPKDKLNINKLKSELKKELKNEVKEELKAEFENKIDINNELKVPLLKLFLNQNEVITNKNNSIETKGIENFNYTNRSINSIDIFLPPNKNISAINDNENETIPGLININSNILYNKNNNNINNNSNEIKKENVIIKKFVKLNGIKSLKKGNKTPDNTHVKHYAFINNRSPIIRKKNFIYHKVPFANNNIYCHNIKKNKGDFNSKNKNSQETKIIKNLNKFNSPNKLNYFANSPRPSHKESLLTFKKIIVKNINNDMPLKGNKTGFEKIIKIPKKIINNLNYIDNNRIIINNKTKNIVYIKTSPNRMKGYEIENIYKKK